MSRTKLHPALTGAVLAVSVALALAACQREPAATTGTPTAPSAATTTPPGAHAITGTATYREKMKMVPGASLRVQLIDKRPPAQPGDASPSVVAELTLKDIAGAPYTFSLPYDPAKLRADGEYVVDATLFGYDGSTMFVTPTPVPVAPAANVPVEILLVRAQAVGEAQAASAALATNWQCGDLRVGANFDNTADNVTLTYSGKTLVIPQAVAASGARYADDKGNEFWTKGDSGTLTLAGEGKHECKQTQSASPWDAAKARNVSYRAVGNEPGWLIEIGEGPTPALHAELDYGSRRIDIAKVDAATNGLNFRGQTGDGGTVELKIDRTPCQDDSGASFATTAHFSAGGKTYEGCGAFLSEWR